MDLKSILEAVLFVSSKPLSLNVISKKLPEFKKEDILYAIRALKEEYTRKGGPIEIVEVARGYQMRTKTEYGSYLKRFVKSRKPFLTKPLIETLAIVAYRQPVSKKEIDRMRGVDSSRALRELLERKLIKVSGRKKPLSSLLFETTDRFLEYFGLKNLDDLPDFGEIEELENSYSGR